MTQPVITPDTAQLPVAQAPSQVAQVASHDAWRTSERSLIGAVLASGSGGRGRRVFAEAVDATGIRYTDFLDREMSAIWFVLDRLYQEGQEIDLSTVWAEVQKSKKAQQYITFDTLTYLANRPSVGHCTHASNVISASVSNSINQALKTLQPLVEDPKIKPIEKLRSLHKIVTDLGKRVEFATKSQTMGIVEGLQKYLEMYETETEAGTVDVGIPTGFSKLDEKIDGWKKRTLNVIAGPPGSGKTVMLMNSALHAVMNGQRVLMVQLELPPDQTFRRLLCSFAGIDSNRLKRHQLTGWETSRLTKAIQKLQEFDKDKRFTLLTMNQPTLEDIKIKLDTLMMDGYDIIFFDYAGGAKITRSHPAQNDLDHHREIYNSIDEWKKVYNIPIVVGAQYGAPQPQKHPGAYTMDMIYSSKYLKHNADTIIFLHPNKQGGDTQAISATQTSLVVVKNRDGEKPYGGNLTVTVKAEMNMFRFIETGDAVSQIPPTLWDIHEQKQPANAVSGGD